MMTHRSIKSSHVQVRTKPALRLCQRSFQKVVVDFLKSRNVPQLLEHGLRSNGRVALTSKVFYAWRRLSHLRSTLLYIAEGEAVAMVPPFAKEDSKAWTIRIPINHRLLASVGPIVCECYWDPMDHELTISDVLHYNRENVWETHGYSERFQLIHTIVHEVIQNTGDFSDCTVTIPVFEKMSEAAEWEEDSAFCAVFQPEDCGMRRFRYGNGGSRDNNGRSGLGAGLRKPYERNEVRHIEILDESDTDDSMLILSKKVQETKQQPRFTNDPNGISIDMLDVVQTKLPAPTPMVTKLIKEKAIVRPVAEGGIECLLELDTKNPLPDVYKLRGEKDNKDLGIAAVRSLEVSLEIRSALKAGKIIHVETVWYAPFKKWEVVRIL